MTERHTVPIRLRAAREALSSWDGFVAFGLGTGLLPKAPGTWGTLLALLLAAPVMSLSRPAYWLLIIGGFALGVWVCNRVGERLGVSDYGGIVIDEIIAFWLVIAFVPAGFMWLLVAFVLFRFFDIAKPWPILELDRRLHGGFGVMFDDIVAAVYTMIILAGLEYLVRS